jgi:uncharacterized protein DUF5658
MRQTAELIQPLKRWRERCKIPGIVMRFVLKRWDTPKSRFGDLAVVIFLVVQCLDGVFTYLGVKIWGPGIEANPIISSAITAGGVVVGLGGAKAVAMAFGILLHLRGVHTLVAVLTAIYFTVAIIPWTALFFAN